MNELTEDQRIVSELILSNEDGKLGKLCSKIEFDYEAMSSNFRVQHEDGSVFNITVFIDEA